MAKKKIALYGIEVPVDSYVNTGELSYIESETLAEFDIVGTRSETSRKTVEVDDEDILEMEFEDGLIRIVTLDQLEEEFPKDQNRGEELEEGVIALPAYLEGYESASRGVIRNILKKLKIIRVDEKLIDLTALALAKKIESQLEPAPGLYKCKNPNKLGKEAKDIKADHPILILLHGTSSSTSGSFGGFYEDDLPTASWEALQKGYGDNVYAFEHATLTKSPVQNAIDLLEYLPENAEVHLISHSRGGLIGEILCRKLRVGEEAFSEEDISFYEKLRGKDEADTLKKVNELLIQKNIKVEKFVRVACPASGTILASQRLDLYLTVILNLLGMIPVLKGNPIYGYVKSFLKAFVKKKEDITVFPGLEAMIPGSPLIRILNNPEVKIESELYVIAGDVKAHGVLRSLAVILTDAFYRTQHDFVVNTLSMFGSAQREKTYYAFYSNKEVSHFKYFINKASQNNVAAALAQYDQIPAGFRPLSQLMDEDGEIVRVRGRLDYVAPGEKEEKEAPYIYVLPGIMGSKLKARKKPVWVNIFSLASGGMKRLGISSPQVEAYALMGSAYRALLKELGKKYNVVPFPYDWRQSIMDSAKLLAEDLEERMDTSNQPFRIVAHSMGGLVVHALYSNHPNTWKRFSEREGSRAIFLGSPLGGSHVIPSLFIRKHKLFKILHSLDVTNNSSDLLNIIKKYPGLLELLPMDAEKDYNDIATWTDIGNYEEDFVEPSKVDLENAKKLSELFKSRPIEGENIAYIAGKDKYTPYKLKIVDNKAMLFGTSMGDSAVTWETGITKSFKNKTWYMRATHGELCSTKKYFPAIIELLDTGNTRLLPKHPIVTRGDVHDVVIPEEYPIVVPSRLALEDAIMGVTPNLEGDAPEFQISVEVCHGDLGNAEHPVAVGHHYGDPIISAERVVDFYMDRKLSQNHDVGLYPGKLETSLVLLNKESKFKGAIVLGLGIYGELNEGKLARSFAHAFTDYAMSAYQRNGDGHDEGEESSDRKLGVSSLLIASDYSGLTIRNSIRALLRGVIEANKSLKNLNNDEAPQILEVEIIEIYKDRVIHAMHELKKVIDEPDFKDQVIIESPFVREVPGKRRRISTSNTVNWWHRLKVEAVANNDDEIITSKLRSIINNPDSTEEAVSCSRKLLLDHFVTSNDSSQNPLKFTSLTDRARAEEEIKSTQRVLIDRLIEASVNTNTWDEETAKTLFHLLIPNNFKDYATDNKNILLIVDEQSASYPWEILHFPNEKNSAPIATQIGLVRQLATGQYSRQINQTITDSVLVIGDPETGSKWAPLPYAQKEAKAVLEIFKDKSFHTVDAIGEKGIDTINKLFSDNYKVIHMAGHGIVDPTDPSKSGMVLDDKTYITAAEIESLPQTPEFVFINCCYLGETVVGEKALSYHKLAANVGTQFIQKGVKAVVAAGWAIDDAAAMHFAESLYKNMFEGIPFGEAVKRARLDTYLQHGGTNTWGAYQCYGDPFYRIVKSNNSGWNGKSDYVDKDEVIVDLENLIQRSESASSRDRRRVEDSLKTLIKEIPPKWKDDSKIIENIGIVYFELALYKKAEKFFKRLRYLPHAENGLGSLAKLANIQMKLALKEYNQIGKLSKESKNRISSAEEIIDSILAIGDTHERWALKGGHYKRKALIKTTMNGVVDNLVKGAEGYKKSHVMLREIEANYYPIINWLTLERISELYGKSRSVNLNDGAKELRLLKRELGEKAEGKTRFWARTHIGAIGIYEVMKKGVSLVTRKKKINEVCRDYENSWRYVGSLRKSENILGQVDFSIKILKKLLKLNSGMSNKTEIEEIVEAYEILYARLKDVFNMKKEKN